MSGTSLDGLDISCVDFSRSGKNKWEFDLVNAATVAFPPELRNSLASVTKISGEELSLLDVQLGNFFGKEVNKKIEEWDLNRSRIDLIASHGQTVFHQPKKGLTLQIGNGPQIAVQTGLVSVVDFRVKDVALGGNGAPLVPLADDQLFSQYAESFLNLGGFANISFRQDEWKSFDICPVNIVLNKLMSSFGMDYDENGATGRSAGCDETILDHLNSLDFYTNLGPRSLGWEWVESEVMPLLAKTDKSTALGTFYRHVAKQISDILNSKHLSSVYITGGGAYNTYLIELIKARYSGSVIIPSKEIVEFKEAIAFAFLGLKKILGETNIYSSVTGASRDSCSGVVHLP